MWDPRTANALLAAVTVTLVVAGAATGLTWAKRERVQQLAAASYERLTLYASALESETSRFSSLPSLIASDSDIVRLLNRPQDPLLRDKASQKLARVSVRTGAMSLAILSADGSVLASSTQLMDRGGDGHAPGGEPPPAEAQTYRSLVNSPDHFAANAQDGSAEYRLVRDIATGTPIGARVVVTVSLAPLEATWVELGMRTKGERLLVLDENGVVVMTSVPTWKFRTVGSASDATMAQLGRYPARSLQPLTFLRDERLLSLGADLGRLVQADADPGGPRLWQEYEVGSLSIRLASLSDLSDVNRAARATAWGGGAAGACVGLLGLYLLHRRRSRQALRSAYGELESLVAERTAELQRANEELTRQIAGREQVEEELLQASKLAVLGQMSAAISHEINQPLTALRALSRNTTKLLEMGRTKAVAENLVSIDQMAERMGRIVTQLKSFARKSAPTTEPVELAAVVRDVMLLLEHRLLQVKAQVIVNVPGDLYVRADVTRLEQVLVNLTANAIDAVAQAATRDIRIDAAARDGRVQIGVSDSGPGMDDVAMERMLEPFFTTKPAGQGLGLGLVISSKIIREFGGSLRAVRTAEGMRFEFDLDAVGFARV